MKVVNFDVNRMLGDLGGENVAFQRSEIRWRRTGIAQVVVMPAATVVDMLGTFMVEYIRREGVIAPGPLAAGLRSPQCHPIKTSISP